MVFPGFEISDNIVGKSVDFDTIRLGTIVRQALTASNESGASV